MSNDSVFIDISKIVIGKRIRQLDKEHVANVANSISDGQLVQPISVRSENGHFKLVGGLHRIEAYKLLGLSTIKAELFHGDELDAELAEIDENLYRKNPSHIEQGLMFIRREEILTAKGKRAKAGDNQYTRGSENFSRPQTTAEIAYAAGLGKSAFRQKVRLATGITPEVRDTIKNTKLDKIDELKELAKVEPDKQQKIVEKVLSGKAKDIKNAKRLVKEDERNEAARLAVEENHPLEGKGFKLIFDSIESYKQHFEPNSIDWIITDPPYAKEYLPLFETLAEFASYVLKPGGSLIVMTGMLFFPQVVAALETGKEIKWYWHCNYEIEGESSRVWHRKINQQHKPLLWYVKGEYDGRFITDVFKSDRNEKDYHQWGQSESGMADIVERFTVPGELIVDPFLGGGTTGVVSVKLNRLFIGMDNDETSLKTAAKRISSVL